MILMYIDPGLFSLPAILFQVIFLLLSLAIFIGVPVTAIIFLIRYLKQKQEYYKTKTDYYNKHMNDRQD